MAFTLPSFSSPKRVRIAPPSSAKSASASAVTEKQNFARRFGAIGETIADALFCFPSLDVIGIVASYAVCSFIDSALVCKLAHTRTRSRLSTTSARMLTSRRTAGVRAIGCACVRPRWAIDQGNRGQPRRYVVTNRHRVCSRRRQRVRQLPRAPRLCVYARDPNADSTTNSDSYTYMGNSVRLFGVIRRASQCTDSKRSFATRNTAASRCCEETVCMCDALVKIRLKSRSSNILWLWRCMNHANRKRERQRQRAIRKGNRRRHTQCH